jgi:hypothetical protein
MQSFVGELVGMVGGSSSGGRTRSAPRRRDTAGAEAGKGKTRALAAPAKKTHPENSIPMNDDDFDDF